MKQCSMPECDREAKVTGLCPACYQYLRYWKNKTPGQIVNRIQQISLWTNRLESMSPRVSVIKRRRKRA